MVQNSTNMSGQIFTYPLSKAVTHSQFSFRLAVSLLGLKYIHSVPKDDRTLRRPDDQFPI